MDKEVKYDYSKQKKGWVKLPNGKGKVKLRKYIKDLARGFNKYPELTFNQKVALFIEGWNENGFDGLRIVHQHLAEMTTEYVKNEIAKINTEFDEIREGVEKITKSSEKAIESVKEFSESTKDLKDGEKH